jgi:hypothetical protein
MNEHHPVQFGIIMAGIPGKGGIKGRSGPPGNMNAFKHGLAAIQKRREEGIPAEHEENVRQQILEGLIADKGGEEQISTATRILAEVIASDASWLMAFNSAIDHIIQNNPKARQNPRGLSQLDGYKRGLVNSLTGNLQKFGRMQLPQSDTENLCLTLNKRFDSFACPQAHSGAVCFGVFDQDSILDSKASTSMLLNTAAAVGGIVIFSHLLAHFLSRTT